MPAASVSVRVPVHSNVEPETFRPSSRRDGFDAVAVIQGNKVTLRPFHEDDIPHLLRWAADPELNRLLEGDYPDTKEGCLQWLQALKSDRHRQSFAVDAREGAFIGDVELDHIAWRSGDAELRIRIGDEAYRNKGYGTEAVKLILGHAFGTLNLRRVYLRVFQFNRRAIASYLKAGFRREGVITRTNAAGVEAGILLMRILSHEFLSAAGTPLQGIVVDM